MVRLVVRGVIRRVIQGGGGRIGRRSAMRTVSAADGRGVRQVHRRHMGLGLARPAPLRDLGEHLLGLSRIGPIGRILLQQRRDHGRERTRMLRLARLLFDHRLHGGQRRGPPERRPAVDRRIKRGAERPQVGGRAGVMTANALGREIVDRADDLAGPRDRRVSLDLGDPEVGEQDTAVPGEEYVAGLDVAVQYAGRVRGPQRTQHPQPDSCRLPGLDAPRILDRVGERVALDQFHHDPRPAVVLQHVVHGDDGRVVDPRGSARLGPGTGEQYGLIALGHVQRGRQLLDRDGTVQHLVMRAPHPAHSAAPDGVDEPVTVREEQALHLIHVSPHSP